MSAVGIYGPQLLDDASDADGAQRRAAAASSHNPWPDSVNELCEEFADVCRSAVDSLEIASALEFEGLSDQAAQRRYGYSDVFALAQDMYYRVPR